MAPADTIIRRRDLNKEICGLNCWKRDGFFMEVQAQI